MLTYKYASEVVVLKAGFDNDVLANVAYSTSHLKRTWKVQHKLPMYVSCRNIVGSRVRNHVHLRFRLSQVAPHLLGSESPLLKLSFKGCSIRGSKKVLGGLLCQRLESELLV